MNQKGSGTRHCRAGQAGSSAVGRGGRRSPSTLRPVPHPAAREVRPAAPHQAEAGTTPTVWEGRTAGIPSPPPTRHSAGLQFPLRHSPGARAAQACSRRKPGREATVLWGKNLFGGDGVALQLPGCRLPPGLEAASVYYNSQKRLGSSQADRPAGPSISQPATGRPRAATNRKREEAGAHPVDPRSVVDSWRDPKSRVFRAPRPTQCSER